jgi:hypothetical protein
MLIPTSGTGIAGPVTGTLAASSVQQGRGEIIIRETVSLHAADLPRDAGLKLGDRWFFVQEDLGGLQRALELRRADGLAVLSLNRI